MIADRNRTGLAFARTATFVALPLRRLECAPARRTGRWVVFEFEPAPRVK
jgi:hypothetical protein